MDDQDYSPPGWVYREHAAAGGVAITETSGRRYPPVDWAAVGPARWFDCKLGKLSDVELARLIGIHPDRIRRRREQLGIPPWSVAQQIESFKHLLGVLTDGAIASLCGVSPKSVTVYRESLGILPVLRPAPRKQVLPTGHPLRIYKPLFGYVSDQEIAKVAGVDLHLVQEVREALGFEPVSPLIEEATSIPTADYHGPWLGYESLLGKVSPAQISREVGVPYDVVEQRRVFLGIAPYKRLSKAVRFDHLLGKVPNSLVAKLAGVSTARIAERRKQLGT